MTTLTRKTISIGFAKKTVIDFTNEQELKDLMDRAISEKSIDLAKEFNEKIMSRGAVDGDCIDTRLFSN